MGSVQVMEMKVKQESDLGIRCRKKEKVLEICTFFLLWDNAEFFFKFLSFVSIGGIQSEGETDRGGWK